MEFSAKQIAQLLQGVVEGNEEIIVNKLCKIEEGEEGGLSFLANPKYTQYIYTTKSSIVIVNQDFVAEEKISATLIRVKDAYSCFANLLEIYNQYRFNKKGISSLAVIDQKATVGEEAYIGE
ncbi:MAG: LpxD N-terminal domain-containing protein, partial [Bacteroidales bacterium]|nr:LpxD N-terminal domain-containing protein [Bacteroidales bacterium]